MQSTVLADVVSAIAFDRFSFYLWSVIFYELCLAVVLLPLLLATGSLGASWARVLALASALSAAVALWSNLDAVAGGYGRGYSLLEGARMHYLADHDEAALTAALAAARDAKLRFALRLPPVPAAP